MIQPAPYCICTIADQHALQSVHESGSNRGSLRDRHPWLVAKELLDKARIDQLVVALVIAVQPELTLTDWALIRELEVVTYSGQNFETRCSFEELRPVNPIFEELYSLLLFPSAEQLHRESLEPVRKYREHLDDIHVHPYAICETPAFIFTELGAKPQ